jgi:hypothetical protein
VEDADGFCDDLAADAIAGNHRDVRHPTPSPFACAQKYIV